MLCGGTYVMALADSTGCNDKVKRVTIVMRGGWMETVV